MKIEKGARVRASIEGYVHHLGDQGVWIENGQQMLYFPNDTLEVLAPPQREFEDGAYYLAPFGQVQRYRKATDAFHLTHDDTWRVQREFVGSGILAQYIKLIPETP